MSEVVLPKTAEVGANEFADVYANDVALRDVVNGELTDENIASGANIAGSKLADSSVSLGKLEKKMLYGVVKSTGSKDRGSEGWTSERLSAGRYKITLSPELGSKPVTTVTPDSEAGNNYVRIEKQSKTEIEVRIFNSSFSGEDRQFDFITIAE